MSITATRPTAAIARAAITTVARSYRMHPLAVVRPPSPKRTRSARQHIALMLGGSIGYRRLARLLNTTPDDAFEIYHSARYRIPVDRDFHARHTTLETLVRRSLA